MTALFSIMHPLSPTTSGGVAPTTSALCSLLMTFGIKYTNHADADHLLSALKEMYVSDDWTGARFCELTNESISRSVID
jgi:hypothetical protein